MHNAAGTWVRARRVIAKAGHIAQGADPRVLVTSPESDAQKIYDTIHCARGETENRINEQHLGLFADRASLSGPAGHSVPPAALQLRRRALENHPPGRASWNRTGQSQASTIRLKILKIGTASVRNTRRIRLFFSSAYPLQDLFRSLLTRLNPA